MSTRLAAVLILSAHVLSAQDWTRFRGDRGLGLGKGSDIPVTFDLQEVNWKLRLPGKGHSSPVTWKGLLFVTCEGEERGKRFLVCVDTKTGKERWRLERGFSPHPQHRFNSFASSTPAVDQDRVYLLWSSGETLIAAAVDHEGVPVWRREVGGFKAQHGSGVSPVVVADTMIVCNDNEKRPSFIMGLDRATGEVRWKHDRKSSTASYATPLVRGQGEETEIILSSTSHGVTSLNPKTGSLNWETGPVFKDQRCVGVPAIADGVLLACAGTGGGGKQSLALRLPAAGDGESPQKLYSPRRALSYVPGPLGVGERFYIFSDGGVVSCLKAADGELVWRSRLEASFYGSPICVGDRIYAVSRSGELFVIAARDRFELLGKVGLGEPASASPAVADGVLYLRTDHHVISVGGGD